MQEICVSQQVRMLDADGSILKVCAVISSFHSSYPTNGNGLEKWPANLHPTVIQSALCCKEPFQITKMSDGSCTKTDSVMDKKEDTKSSKETGEKNENEEEEIGEIFIEILKYV